MTTKIPQGVWLSVGPLGAIGVSESGDLYYARDGLFKNRSKGGEWTTEEPDLKSTTSGTSGSGGTGGTGGTGETGSVAPKPSEALLKKKGSWAETMRENFPSSFKGGGLVRGAGKAQKGRGRGKMV